MRLRACFLVGCCFESCSAAQPLHQETDLCEGKYDLDFLVCELQRNLSGLCFGTAYISCEEEEFLDVRLFPCHVFPPAGVARAAVAGYSIRTTSACLMISFVLLNPFVTFIIPSTLSFPDCARHTTALLSPMTLGRDTPPRARLSRAWKYVRDKNRKRCGGARALTSIFGPAEDRCKLPRRAALRMVPGAETRVAAGALEMYFSIGWNTENAFVREFRCPPVPLKHPQFNAWCVRG